MGRWCCSWVARREDRQGRGAAPVADEPASSLPRGQEYALPKRRQMGGETGGDSPVRGSFHWYRSAAVEATRPFSRVRDSVWKVA